MQAPFTLTFEQFWEWLVAHPNCVLRAGTPEAVLYDDEDLHWHFAIETSTDDETETHVVQILRGKRFVGELLLSKDTVTYVEAVPTDREEEHTFELIQEGRSTRLAAYFFVLSHGFDEHEGGLTSPRVH